MKKLALVTALVLIFGAASAFGSAQAEQEKVVIYSPHGEEMLTDLADRFESETGIAVEFLTAGGGELVDRVRAERANPQADVFYGNPSSVFSELASEGIFAAYTPRGPVASIRCSRTRMPTGSARSRLRSCSSTTKRCSRRRRLRRTGSI